MVVVCKNTLNAKYIKKIENTFDFVILNKQNALNCKIVSQTGLLSNSTGFVCLILTMIVSPPLLSSWEVCIVLRACECCYKQPILISDSEWLLSKVVALSTHITCWQVHQWNFGWLWSIPFSIKINLRMLFPFLIRVSTVM